MAETQRDILERVVKRIYSKYLKRIGSQSVLDEIRTLLSQNDFDGVIQVITRELEGVVNDIPEAIQQAAKTENARLSELLAVALLLNLASERIVQVARDAREDMLSRILGAETRTVQESVVESISQNKSAYAIVALGLGLSPRLRTALSNYGDVLRRQQKDGVSISDAQLDRMVSAYRRRLLDIRADQVSRSVATRAFSEIQEAVLENAIDRGQVDPTRVVRTWNRIADSRVRDAHNVMQGQKAKVGEVFVDGSGNQLRYPGDPRAPAETTANCRCSLTIGVA